MSQDGRVREVMCAEISVFKHSERWRCQDLSAYVATAMCDRGRRTVEICETRAEICRAQLR